ncbi:hypothetical protein [Deinococcus sp.]|uniref:hypothetical protein n=1 Tax=Deinococcus sp. TaxID=47478 RepID=UPI0025B9E8C2|nr:hypothetical protein [Deinococcus sp.]
MSSSRRPFFQLLALGSVLSGMVSAQSGPGSFFPPNYLSRFSTTELTASNMGGTTGFGVRYFPLPLNTDLRVSLVKRPHYWEYALTTRQNDTTYSAGLFDNGDLAPTGISKIEVRHDPWKGVQYTGIIQWVGPVSDYTGNYQWKDAQGKVYGGNAPLSRFTAGYAFTTWKDRVRILNNVGVGMEQFNQANVRSGFITAPYTQTEISANYGEPIGKDVNVNLGSTVRLFTFPTYSRYQASIDVNPSIEVRPLKGLTLNASHLERFAKQNDRVPLSDLNFGRYRETNASISYRIDDKNDFSVNMIRTRVKANWTDKQYFLYNDVLFRFNALPVLIGPTIGYQWYPAAANNTRWLFSFSFAPK